MKHNVILNQLESLDRKLISLGNLIDVMENGDTPKEISDLCKSDADVKSLASFLEDTPGVVHSLEERVSRMIARINDIIQEDGKEKTIEN